MKLFKKMMALVIAMVMMVAMAVPTMAATITINKAGNITTDHKYEAYQIFSGTLSGDGTSSEKLSNIEWGAGVNSAALLNALKADTTIGSKFTNAATAEDVAKAISGATADETVAFSRVVAEHLGTKAGEGTGKIENLDDGYYFVKDVTEIAEEGTDALSAYIVQLVGAATINIKTDAPKIEKKLKNHDELEAAYRDANNVGIGDTVDYRITSTVPDMSNYKQYYFIVNDTLSKGLTYQNDLVVKVGDDTLTATNSDNDTGKTYKLTTATDADGNTTLEIVFSNFKQYAKDDAVKITYTAKLNENAKIGVDGNPNEVQLTYSNNPNKEGTGQNKPGPEDDDVTGTTPKDTVITYSTNLKILKVNESNEPLQGVTFTISGYGENDKTTYAEEFVEDENGEYYKLADGKYTKTAPTTLTAGKYDTSAKDKKFKIEVKKNNTVTTTTYVAKQGTTGVDGTLDIGALIASGSLPAGYYVIHEDSTVDGYNVLDHDITVKVTAKVGDTPDINFEEPQTTTKATWEVVGEGTSVKEDGTIEIKIENKAGATLPETGGIGTTIFYIIGAILVVGAGIILVTRRRMSAN